MRLVLYFKEAIQDLLAELASELEQMAARINTWASREHNSDGSHDAITCTSVSMTTTTQTTVGAAGGASALPATPTGYLTVTINGTARVIPFYARS